MIIDIHTHAWPDKISAKAQNHLESLLGVGLHADPTVASLIKSMDANAIDYSVLCAVASRPEQVPSINRWLKGIGVSRIKIFAAMHPAYKEWREELSRISAFANGVKFQPEFQDFYVDDVSVYPIYEFLTELKLPVLFHCGEELSGTQVVHSSPERIAKVLRDFPRLKVIGGHFGGFRLWPAVEEYLIGKEIYLDTSCFFEYAPGAWVRKMLLKHSPDRLLFGSDFPIGNPAKDLAYLSEADIPDSLKEKILWRNASGLLNITM